MEVGETLKHVRENGSPLIPYYHPDTDRVSSFADAAYRRRLRFTDGNPKLAGGERLGNSSFLNKRLEGARLEGCAGAILRMEAPQGTHPPQPPEEAAEEQSEALDSLSESLEIAADSPKDIAALEARQ